MRHVLYLTGTRADFGLMTSTLNQIQQSIDLELSILVTGMHLDPNYGNTVSEIEQSGFRICGKVVTPFDSDSKAHMARAIGHELLGIIDVLEHEHPDIVLLLGDRGEMLAGAIAALHLNIPIIHIHGGERSGTVDEPVRHAISKLSHYHFTSTEEARDRLVRMGEFPNHIFVTGAPGLDDIVATNRASRSELCQKMSLDADQPLALVVFHPVVQLFTQIEEQTHALMQALIEDCGYQALVLMPNSDTGGKLIQKVLEEYVSKRCLTMIHLPRQEYLDWLATVDLLIGNSSSGIIEAASLGTNVVNIGERQNYRERNSNVVDTVAKRELIVEAIAKAEKLNPATQNIYGDGKSANRIVELLTSLPLNQTLLMKANAY